MHFSVRKSFGRRKQMCSKILWLRCIRPTQNRYICIDYVSICINYTYIYRSIHNRYIIDTSSESTKKNRLLKKKWMYRRCIDRYNFFPRQASIQNKYRRCIDYVSTVGYVSTSHVSMMYRRCIYHVSIDITYFARRHRNNISIDCVWMMYRYIWMHGVKNTCDYKHLFRFLIHLNSLGSKSLKYPG